MPRKLAPTEAGKQIFLRLLAGLRHPSNLAYLFFSHKLTVSHVLTTWHLHDELMNTIPRSML
tara:strand:- start:535 stop:720 length:186 start_codon:yes stop_codon:yes gene_type:complete